MKCPECKVDKGFVRVGFYRVQCINCNALLKNEEIIEKEQSDENSNHNQ